MIINPKSQTITYQITDLGKRPKGEFKWLEVVEQADTTFMFATLNYSLFIYKIYSNNIDTFRFTLGSEFIDSDISSIHFTENEPLSGQIKNSIPKELKSTFSAKERVRCFIKDDAFHFLWAGKKGLHRFAIERQNMKLKDLESVIHNSDTYGYDVYEDKLFLLGSNRTEVTLTVIDYKTLTQIHQISIPSKELEAYISDMIVSKSASLITGESASTMALSSMVNNVKIKKNNRKDLQRLVFGKGLQNM